jgi:hypothetical protein
MIVPIFIPDSATAQILLPDVVDYLFCVCGGQCDKDCAAHPSSSAALFQQPVAGIHQPVKTVRHVPDESRSAAMRGIGASVLIRSPTVNVGPVSLK